MNPDLPQPIQSFLQSLVPVVVVRGTTIVYSNEAADRVLYGESGLSLVGVDALRFVHPSDRDDTVRLLQQALQDPAPINSVPRTLVDGQGRTLQVVGAAMSVRWEEQPAVAATFQTVSIEEGARERSARRGVAAPLDALSHREKQIALLLAQGFGVQEIAGLLNIQRETVRTHIKAVYRKTGTHTRVELTRLVLGAPKEQRRKPVAGKRRPAPAASEE